MEGVMRTLPLYLAGEPRTSGQELLVLDKYTQAAFARVAKAGTLELEQAIAAAHAARGPCAAPEKEPHAEAGRTKQQPHRGVGVVAFRSALPRTHAAVAIPEGKVPLRLQLQQ